jgi:molecular chaperone Hsp33
MNEVQGFILEGSGVRGAVVRLEETWRQVIAEHSYTPQVRTLLGEGVAATVLLASGIKAKPRSLCNCKAKGLSSCS